MHMQLFEVRGERDEGRVRIRVSGEVDVATAPQIATCLSGHMAAGVEQVELDLSAVAFIDSTGVRLLLRLAADASSDGWALGIVPSEAVRRIVCVLRLEERLLATPSVSH